ncbi:hypothetical protein CMU68_16255 [Elizabethkingia anophelis]|nr:hypothetical protein [Elizabethkingia anophelis]MDV3680628.1 hypothetical protein [Elizabethkingia anophelis]
MMKLKLQAAGIPLLALSFAVISCKSTDGSIEDNNTNPSAFNVRVNLSGVENIEETPVLQASAGKSNSVSPSPQQTKISLGDDSFIMATLTPQSNTASVASQAQASINPMAAATPPAELGTGIRYKVAVYDASGNYVTEKEFVYKNGETDGFQLNGGQNYTFVAYSVNSASSTPSINNGGTLAAAKLSGISGDLMYFKKNMTVTGNKVNELAIMLKHQFSKITTKLDARQVGNISAVTNAAFTPAFASADISFATDALSYNNSLSGGQAVSFQSKLNDPVVTSVATQVIARTNDTNPEGILNIGAVTIDGVTKNLKLDKIKITPGVQYNLNLRFGPCRQDILPEKFDVANGVSKTFTMPATDFGFTFDIYKLDNSFNLTINGTKMSTAEINFEDGYGVNGRSTSSIRFQDKTKYGSNGIPTIYSMEGVAGKPLIRVVISKDGQVSLFGSKSSGGPLEPMELYNGSTFNKIKWNTTGSNTVTATQMVFGTTYMSGFGTGKQIVTCTP